jgi:hypothetical protein
MPARVLPLRGLDLRHSGSVSEKGCGVIFATENLAITPNKWIKEKSPCSTACCKKNLGTLVNNVTPGPGPSRPLRPREAQLAAAL